MTKNKRNYEALLNEQLTDSYSYGQALDQFEHWFKDRKTAEKYILPAHDNRQLGTLLRKHDANGFETGFNEWSKK